MQHDATHEHIPAAMSVDHRRIDPLFTNEGPLNVARDPEAQALISASQRREKVCPREKIGASEWKTQIISVQAPCTAWTFSHLRKANRVDIGEQLLFAVV